MLTAKRIALGVAAFALGLFLGFIPYVIQLDNYQDDAKAEAERALAGVPPDTVTTTVEPRSTQTQTVTTQTVVQQTVPSPSSAPPSSPAPAGQHNQGYVGSDAYVARKYCHEQYPGFTEQDQYAACVESFGVAP